MRLLFAVLITFSTLAIVACKKERETQLIIRMTDAPLAVEEVNIDLKQVQVKLDKDTTSWVTLETNAKIYNLLGLQNGVDTLIADGTFTSGNAVKEIRLIVGTENTIKADGVVHPLTIPSGAESGLKIKVGKPLRASLETILIDFDAALSVQQETDGYKLRPVLKLK